ncbi:MAG TPA: cytochrome c [Ferrovibrio sp.]|uniref:c-type cytochrome n=1 Tax=Ferrovibrio sp. TaxID=1917215 RepID=UPI002ED38F6B
MAQWHKAILAAAVGIAVATVGGMAIAQADIIKARQEGMKGNGRAMKELKQIIDAGGPASAAVKPAESIAAMSAKIPGAFPKGSDKGDTKAKPEIWANWADFEKHASNSKAAAEKLVADAKGGSMDMVKADFKALGQTCGACHKLYRVPEQH